MKYLMIENDARHIPSVDMLVTLGLSGSRDGAHIGQFGSGFKYTLALLARTPYRDSDGYYHDNMIADTRVCLGKSVCTYELRDQTAKKADGAHIDYKRLFMKGRDAEHTGTNKTYDLNMSADFGAIDWNDISMGLRELISNAFDGQDDYGSGRPVFQIVETDKRGPRAKDGKIRVYVPLTDDVEAFYRDLYNYYLQMRPNYDPDAKILPKSDRNGLRVYKKGVRVYNRRSDNALFDYNIDVYLDESRNADRSSVKSAVSTALGYYATAPQLAEILSQDCFEHSCLDSWDFRSEERKPVYQEAFRIAFGDKIVCENDFERQLAERRGLDAVVINEDIYSCFRKVIPNSALNVLSEDERNGRVISEPTDTMIGAYDKVWETVVSFGMNYGKEKPTLRAFDEGSDGGARTLGIYKENTVYLHKDIGGTDLISTIVEELCHHCAACGDLSRDFQNWCCNLIARMIG